MKEEGTEKRPEPQAASHHPPAKRDPNDALIEMRQLHDEVTSLLAASKRENSTTCTCTSAIMEEGMHDGEGQGEDFDLSKAGRLPKDTHSLLVIAPVRSVTFAVSLAVFAAQMMTLTLLVLDFTKGAPNNRLGMPVYVTWPLRVAQLFCIVMSAISGKDVVKSLFILQNGYDEANLTRVLKGHYFQKEETGEAEDAIGSRNGIRKRNGEKEDDVQPTESFKDEVHSSEIQPSVEIPRRLRLRWFASIFLRLAQGLFSLGCNFLLTMRSVDIRFVMLSYGAVAFVSNTSEIAFQLLALGFCGNAPIHHCRCKILTTLSSIDDQGRDKWRFGKRIRITSLASVTIFVALLAAWWTLSSRQATGQYLTKSIYVQFGAEPSKSLYLYSGVYDLHMRSHNYFPTTGAVIYKERALFGDSPSYFMYCDDDKSWVFFAKKPPEGKRDRFHPCRQAWLARSSKVNSYNILSAASAEWKVQTEDRFTEKPIQSVMMDFRMEKQKECDRTTTYGPNCEFSVWCEVITIPYATFHSTTLPQSSPFQLHGIDVVGDGIVLKNYNSTYADLINTLPSSEQYETYQFLSYPTGAAVLVHDRPVYYNKVGALENQSKSVYAIILSCGRYYGRFVVVVDDETRKMAETEQEQIVRTSLDLYQLLKRGWQNECGYEGEPRRWMCGYNDISVLLSQVATHFTDKYVLLSADSDTGSAISLPWNVKTKGYSWVRVDGRFSCCILCTNGTSFSGSSFSGLYR